MNKWSWAWTCVAALAVAACGTPWDELGPRSAEAPTPPDGVIVGVAVVARTPGTPWEATTVADIYLTYDQGGTAGRLQLTRSRFPPYAGLDVKEAVESGLAVSYRPFAFKLKAGQGEFRALTEERVGLANGEATKWVPIRYKDDSGNQRTIWSMKQTTVTETYPIVNTAGVPSATFDVEPGKVVYIGRIGMLLSRRAQKAIIGSEPSADLAMIRERFPNLAGVEISVRPVRTTPGTWPTLAEAWSQAAGR